MASGTINLTQSATSGSYIDSKIVWYATADEEKNESDVTARIYVRKDNDDTTLTIATTGTWKYSMTINGKAFSGSVSKDVLLDWVLLATVSVSDIDHDDDGSKSITIKGSVTAPTGTTLAGHKASGSGTATFDTIPRASSIDSLACATKYFNGKLTYKYTPQSSSFYNRCNISLALDGEYIAVKSVLLGKKSASQQTVTVTLSEDEQAIIYNELPAANKGTLRFTFHTYSDSDYSTQVGDPQYREISLYVPKNDNTLPSPGVTLAPESTLAAPFDSLYIQGKSKVKATFAGKGKYGATVKSYSMSVEGETYDSSDDYISDYLTGYGSIDVVAAAKDTREYTGEETKSINVIAYSKPKIMAATDESEIICARCDEDGDLTDSGTYLKIKARRSYSKCVDADGVQNNFCMIRYRYKTEGGSYSSWKSLLAKDSLSSNTVDSDALLSGALDVKTTYIVQVGVLDDLGGYQNAAFTIGTEEVYMHRTQHGLGIGMYVQDDYMVDVSEDWDVRIRGGLEVGGRSSVASLKLGIVLPNSADLNDYKTPGNYYSPSVDVSSTLSNAPYSGGGFGLEVRELQSSNYIRQTIYYARTTWMRHWGGTEWSGWIRHLMTSEDTSYATDFVVEQGSSGIWEYRKWKSGFAECWGTATVSRTFDKEWGSLYVCSSTKAYAYPFEFAERPAENATIRTEAAACWTYAESGGNGLNTTTQTALYCAARPTAVTDACNLYIDYHVFGRWK